MVVVFSDKETTCNVTEYATKYEFGGYQKVFLFPAPLLNVPHGQCQTKLLEVSLWQNNALSMNNPFRYFKASPEIIRLTVLMYGRIPLSLRQVEDLLYERGIDVSYEVARENVWFWWNRFGPVFGAEIRKKRSIAMGVTPQWCPKSGAIWTKFLSGLTEIPISFGAQWIKPWVRRERYLRLSSQRSVTGGLH